MRHVGHDFGASPLSFLALFCWFCPKFEIPHKNSPPIFFVICWCDDILFISIHGFVVSWVDLSFPQFSPLSIHEIHQILPPNHQFPPQIKFRSPNPDLESLGRTSGPQDEHPGHRARHPAPRAPNLHGSGHWPPDIRPLGFQPSAFHRFDHN